MKNLFKKHKYTTKIFAIYGLIVYATVMLLYLVIPTILNYLPETINTQFDKQMSSGLSYNTQILLIGTCIILLSFIYLAIILKNIFKFEKVKFEDEEWTKKTKFIEKIRTDCYKMPYMIFLAQCPIGMLITSIILACTDSHQVIMITKIFLLILSFDVSASVLTFIFMRQIFTKILLELPYGEKNNWRNMSVSNRIQLLIIPLVLVALFFTVLVGYSRITTEKGEVLFDSYKMQLESVFDPSRPYTVEEIKQSLSKINKINIEDNRVLIINSEEGISIDNQEISNFILKYTTEISQKYNGQIMDSYGTDTQGIMRPIYCSDIDDVVYVGIIYDLSAGSALMFLIISSFLFFILNFIVIRYISMDLTSNISLVLERLKGISEGKYDTNFEAHKLKVTSNDEIGDLVRIFNKIQKIENNYILEIQENQETIMEQDRLASLGQFIGGIAHNLKTPIMSIAGNIQGMEDLINEYDLSIGDTEVTNEDHKEIAKDMITLVEKTKVHLSYMSDIISAVKGQASQLDSKNDLLFDVEDVIKKVNIFMKHELKNSLVELRVNVSDEVENKCMKGDENTLVQVLNNFVQNAIYACKDTKNKFIELNVYLNEKGICFEIKDYGIGMPNHVKEKVFKEMITTKGKNGTGLGLYMSYSTIKGKFKGNIEFETKENKGTTFWITIPVSE
ncbi:MAG: HAMP domain-containing histidine kinase [Clostridiales bacterium]|nr:HAMP domain-containing histidine kinase [Clostridiales bacterium]